jgi:FtsH-binding integral membrane protein
MKSEVEKGKIACVFFIFLFFVGVSIGVLTESWIIALICWYFLSNVIAFMVGTWYGYTAKERESVASFQARTNEHLFYSI